MSIKFYTYLLLSISIWLTVANAKDEQLAKTYQLQVNGLTRQYQLYVPNSLNKTHSAALVLAFHGGGGDGQKMAKLTKFNSLAAQEGFIVAYPDGYDHQWNDGREVDSFETYQKGVDDVLFMTKMIAAIHQIHPIDSTRIFATGISNGGIFCHYLAGHLSERIAAIAPVVANMAVPFHEQFNPIRPVSVLIIQGDKDKLIPINGGEVARGNRGEVISMDATIQKWFEANGCSSEVTRGTLPDREPDDGCQVEWTTYQNCQPGIELKVFLIKGGGHTWPGGPQYRSKFVIGNVCRDFNATEMIWEFFKTHPRQN